MTLTTVHMSISLDGYVAGPNQSMDDPIGEGGMNLHDWHRCESVAPDDQPWVENLMRPRGAVVMGRNMYGPVRGPWESHEEWSGWWGDEPPYYAPVFVLTHFAHDPIEMQGGTTFHFVTDGVDSALAQARAVAGPEGEVLIAGGASTVRQAIDAGAVDEIVLTINPVVMGRGERLWEGVTGLNLEVMALRQSPTVTHVRYRVVR